MTLTRYTKWIIRNYIWHPVGALIQIDYFFLFRLLRFCNKRAQHVLLCRWMEHVGSGAAVRYCGGCAVSCRPEHSPTRQFRPVLPLSLYQLLTVCAAPLIPSKTLRQVRRASHSSCHRWQCNTVAWFLTSLSKINCRGSIFTGRHQTFWFSRRRGYETHLMTDAANVWDK